MNQTYLNDKWTSLINAACKMVYILQDNDKINDTKG